LLQASPELSYNDNKTTPAGFWEKAGCHAGSLLCVQLQASGHAIAISLSAGQGRGLQQDMDNLLKELLRDIPECMKVSGINKREKN